MRCRYKLYIVGEVTVRVNHCLLALPGVKKTDLRRVISHYQALAQVDGYTRKLPGVVREAVDDTAGAARMVFANGWRWGPESFLYLLSKKSCPWSRQGLPRRKPKYKPPPPP
jgi:hypothetical protein